LPHSATLFFYPDDVGIFLVFKPISNYHYFDFLGSYGFHSSLLK